MALKVIKTEEIPAVLAQEARIVERTSYKCPVCGIENYDEDVIDRHYAREHACTRKDFAGTELLYFENKPDMEFWAEKGKERQDHGDCFVRWFGAGWYYLKTSYNTRFCTDEYTPIRANEWAQKIITENEARIVVLRNLLEEIKVPPEI